jgi:hypothetical protein
MLKLMAASAPAALPGDPVGIDIRPEGPTVVGVQASGDEATITPLPGSGVFQVDYPSGKGKPAAHLSFQETDINDRLGLAVDIQNCGRVAVRVYADLNGDTWVRGYLGCRRLILCTARGTGEPPAPSPSGCNATPKEMESFWSCACVCRVIIQP